MLDSTQGEYGGGERGGVMKLLVMKAEETTHARAVHYVIA